MADDPAVPPHLLGTPDFPRSRDLSQFVVHMTTREEDLANILVTGRLEARKPHGFSKSLFKVEEKHRSCCLSEMPLTELSRLSRFGQYGIAFKKDWLRAQGGQRVWYLDEGSAQLAAVQEIKAGLVNERAWDHIFWTLTPFIDMVVPGVYSWEHEREWRVVGDLHFELSDIALVIAPDGTAFTYDDAPQLGTPVLDPRNFQYRWWGGSIDALGPKMELLVEQFLEDFASPEDAELPYDPEDGVYMFVGMEEYSTEDAVVELFEEFPEAVRAALIRHLNGVSVSWVQWAEVTAYEDDREDAYEEHLIQQYQEQQYQLRTDPMREL